MNHYITTYAAHFNTEHSNHSGGDSVALGVARASEGTGNVTGDRGESARGVTGETV